MKDGIGQPLHEGNFVQVMIGTQPIRGFIMKFKEGGVSIATVNKGQPIGQQPMTPDTLILQIEVPLLDAAPGQNHAAVIRIPVPDKEVIVPISVKEAAN